MAMAVISSPLQNPGSHRCFCSSVARRMRYGAITSFASGKPRPLAPDRAISSVTTAWKRKSGVPPPP